MTQTSLDSAQASLFRERFQQLHDAVARDTEASTGGANGSIRFELDRRANYGLTHPFSHPRLALGQICDWNAAEIDLFAHELLPSIRSDKAGGCGSMLFRVHGLHKPTVHRRPRDSSQ